MKVLVTGGAGFIGSHVVDALVDAGADVVVLDALVTRPGAEVPDDCNRAADIRVASLHDPAALTAAVADVDAVCHLAAKVGLGVDFGDVEAYVKENDAGTAALLGALWRRGFDGRLVVASSMVVYGEGLARCAVHGRVRPAPRRADDLDAGRFEPPCPRCGRPLAPVAVDEDVAPDPRNVYAATKLHTEHLSFAFGRESTATVCALRYHNVYGPRMPRDTPYAGVAAIFLSALSGGRAPLVFEDGGQRRDFVHVRDVARANVLALDSSWQGACNVASGRPHTVGEMASALAEAHRRPHQPPLVPVVTGQWRLGDVRHIVASPRLAVDVLGFEAQVPFAAGMAELAGAPLP